MFAAGSAIPPYSPLCHNSPPHVINLRLVLTGNGPINTFTAPSMNLSVVLVALITVVLAILAADPNTHGRLAEATSS
jgi:hypothetical protein